MNGGGREGAAGRRRLGFGLLPLAALLAVTGWTAGCGGGGSRPEKPAGSALWLESGAAVPTEELGALAAAGIGELFLEAGSLSSAGPAGVAVEALPIARSPGRASATLVVGGSWSGGQGDVEAAAAALTEGLEALVAGAREKGWVPVGIHFEVDAGSGLESRAELLSALRGRLDGRLFLSSRIERDELAQPAARELASAVDFLVAPLYGQRPGEPEEPAAWDLVQAEEGLRRLEELDCDYLVEISTIGRVLRGSGGANEETTRGSLGELVRAPAVELSHGFTLETIDARSYRFNIKSPATCLGWDLRSGESLHLLRLGSHNLEEYHRRLGALELRHHRGELYFRWAAPEEGFSLSTENLLSALAPEPALARLRLVLEPEGGNGARRRYRVSIENLTAEPTDVAVLSSNFVELEAPGGYFGRVDPGSFARWELLRQGPGGKWVRSFRNASMLRLYATYLGPRERRESGVIEVVGGEARARAEFLLPDGSDLALTPETETAAP